MADLDAIHLRGDRCRITNPKLSVYHNASILMRAGLFLPDADDGSRRGTPCTNNVTVGVHVSCYVDVAVDLHRSGATPQAVRANMAVTISLFISPP